MVLDKRGLSVILLVFGAVISVYMVLLADPTAAQNNGGGTTNGTTNQTTNQNNTNQNNQITDQNDSDLDDNAQEPTNENKPQRQEKSEVIINVPNKPLPPTGGLPVYGTVAGFILAGAGLLALGIGIGRDQRR